MFAVMWYESWRVEEVSLGREEGYYAVRSQRGEEAGGDVQGAPGKADMLCYDDGLLFSPLPVLVSLFLALVPLDKQLFLQQSLRQPDRGTCSESVERCNAGQSST
jgi:hypothetical protein